MTGTAYTAFFGDAERTFSLTAPMIRELERKTGAGIGAFCQRLFARQFSHDDLGETIRLALIGGGETPERAAELVAAYVDGRPYAETLPLAVEILRALWFGTPPKPAPAPDTTPAPEQDAAA
jgi:hypothetical protein